MRTDNFSAVTDNTEGSLVFQEIGFTRADLHGVSAHYRTEFCSRSAESSRIFAPSECWRGIHFKQCLHQN